MYVCVCVGEREMRKVIPRNEKELRQRERRERERKKETKRWRDKENQTNQIQR